LLQGYKDGLVAVFSMKFGNAGAAFEVDTKYQRVIWNADRPVMAWERATEGQAVTWLQWSPHRPGIFFVADAHNVLHIWWGRSFYS
jgi:hypothetical protein